MENENASRTIYEDERGWKYMVMQGLGEHNWKARYQKPGKSGWKCCAALPWRNTPEFGHHGGKEELEAHRITK